MEKKLVLFFRGNKTELHKQLKAYCVEAEKSMNETIIELIENHLKNNS